MGDGEGNLRQAAAEAAHPSRNGNVRGTVAVLLCVCTLTLVGCDGWAQPEALPAATDAEPEPQPEPAPDPAAGRSSVPPEAVYLTKEFWPEDAALFTDQQLTDAYFKVCDVDSNPLRDGMRALGLNWVADVYEPGTRIVTDRYEAAAAIIRSLRDLCGEDTRP